MKRPRPRTLVLLSFSALLACSSDRCGCGSKPNKPPGLIGTPLASSDPRGQLPPDEPKEHPAPPKRLADLTAITAGGARTCAVKTDGSVYCWGNNERGRLGIPVSTRCSTAIPCVTLPAKIALVDGVSALALFSGDGGPANETCTLSKTGEVYCWRGATKPEGAVVTNAIDIAAGGEHACAAKKDGSVACWGVGAESLGYEAKDKCAARPGEPAQERPCSKEAKAVPGIDGAIQVAVGDRHSCARRKDGRVLCWGANDRGQLGDGTQAPRRQPKLVSGLEGVTDLRAGPDHTCALKSDGAVWCWGAADGHRLGAPAPTCEQPTAQGTKLPCVTTPRAVAELGDVVEVRVGPALACARKKDGAILCWGDNRLGKIAALPRAVGLPPTALPAIDDVAELTVGGEHVCVRRSDGTAQCLGANTYGQLGDGTESPHAHAGDVLETARVPSRLRDAVEVRASGNNTCARLASGAILCWGEIAGGSSRRTATEEIAKLDRVTELAIGDAHRCARLEDGSISCWGDSSSGQLGVLSLAYRQTPAPIAGIQAAKLVRAIGNSTCAIAGEGSAFCWGPNATPSPGRVPPKPHAFGPFEIADVKLLEHLAVSPGHACGRKADGSVVCWGNNDAGQVGAYPLSGTKSPTPVVDVADAMTIAVSESHSCALLKTGHVRCWGLGTSGQLGRDLARPDKCQKGTTESCSAQPVEVQFLDDAVELAVGVGFSCARTKGGAVKCWGSGEFGALGDRRAAMRSNPEAVPGLEGIEQITAGRAHVCARGREGRIWCWGANASGQLGDGTTTDRHVPWPVVR